MNPPKDTSPGWPDPTEWVNRLRAMLDERGADYLAATAQRAKNPDSYTEDGYPIEAACTLEVYGIVSAITRALHELPSFKRHSAMAALNDLTFALYELAAGGSPLLLKRGEPLFKGAQFGHDSVIGNVALSLRLLKLGCKFSDAAARKTVAEILARHGFRGKKGGPLSASTLQDWQDKYNGFAADHPVREAIEYRWQEWTSSPEWGAGVTIEGATAWIELLAQKPEFANKVRTSGLR